MMNSKQEQPISKNELTARHLTAFQKELKAAALFSTEMEKYGHLIPHCLRTARNHLDQYHSDNPDYYEAPDFSDWDDEDDS